MPRDKAKAKVERGLLSEIKQALGLERPKPPLSISIPGDITDTDKDVFPQTDSDNSETAEYLGEEQLVPIRDDDDSPQSSSSKRESDGDSFMYQLATNSNISIGSFSSSLNSSRYYIGSIPDGEEASIQSRVSRLDADDLSQGELVELVQRLYDNLKRSDKALAEERMKRKSREKTLFKLAKELGKRKEKIADQKAEINYLSEELDRVLGERNLFESQLKAKPTPSMEAKLAKRAAVEKEMALIKVNALYKTAKVEHENRIKEMNSEHSKQCEQLCFEVVQANKEVVRLQKKLEEAGTGRVLTHEKILEIERKSSLTSYNYVIFAVICMAAAYQYAGVPWPPLLLLGIFIIPQLI